MTYIASGATFNYRTQLQGMGGNFRAHNKTWEFQSLTPRDIAYINRMVGVMLRNTADDATEPMRTVRRSAEPIFVGDDPTYINAFAGQNPITHFGFSSLSKMIDYIQSLPPMSGPRAAGWSHEQTSWRGTTSMDAAILLARDGWLAGTDRAAEILEILTADNAERKAPIYDVAGGRVNVGRMLSGNPVHMSHKTKQPGKRVITLFVNISMVASIRSETAILKAACIAAMVDLLETRQFSCDIIAVGMTDDSRTDQTVSQTTVRVKSAGEALNLNDLVFALGHPSMQRRFHFALKSHDALRSIWSGMGKSTYAFNRAHKPGPNEFYIPHMSPALQDMLRGETLLEKARSMINLIKPEGLPLTLRN